MPATRHPNRLALRIAAVVAAVVGPVATLALALAVRPVLPTGRLAALAVGLALAAGLTAYAAVYSHVARRLELARGALREARKRRFESLDALAATGSRDELDAVVFQAYRAGRTLQAEIERLERLENYRREFLGDVSHELRTPLFALTGFAESLLDGALDDDRVRRRFVEKILANAHRLDALSRDLSEISRIETGELAMHVEPFDLRLLAEETVEALQPVAAERAVGVAVEIPAGLPPVVADRERIRQVVANLVENATKYNHPGGHVALRAAVEAGGEVRPFVRFAVEDDGIGIAPEAVPRLTERFFRVDKSRSRDQGGTGLGLAIVKHILEAHGQRLTIESTPGEGSTFSFALPAYVRGRGTGASPS